VRHVTALSSTLADVRLSKHIKRAACGCAALATVAGTPGLALAQGEGVHVDPNSPAGKEYALPLEEARRNAAPSGQGSAGATDSGNPLFGAGITRDGSDRGEDLAAGAGGGGNGESGDGAAGGSVPGGREAARAAIPAVQQGGDVSSGLLTGLIALGVLICGGAIGLVVRSVRRQNQPA
jgi:hypothetical protein